METGIILTAAAMTGAIGCAVATLFWLSGHRRLRQTERRMLELEKQLEAALAEPQFLTRENERLSAQVIRLEALVEASRTDERTRAQTAYDALKTDFDALQRSSALNLEQRSAAETRAKELEARLATLTQERDDALAEQRRQTTRNEALVKENEVLKVQMDETQRRMHDWEESRKQHLEQSKEALHHNAVLLSNKLLEDHKREQAEAQKQNEAVVQKTTAQLAEQLTKVTQHVSALEKQAGDAKKVADTVWQALTSPSGAGQFAEIGLENLLKNFGFQPDVDFIMQYSITDGDSRLRPDAVLFLPHGRVMVLDCKATKHLLDYADAQDDVGREQALKQLAARLNQHLKDLTSKDYRAAIQSHLKRPGYQSADILMGMYLPSESALDLAQQADPEFRASARKAGILLTSPTSMDGLLSIFRLHIHQERQEKNYETILAAVGSLLESVGTVAAHATKVGEGIRTAARAYESFAKSTNRYLLSRARRAIDLGVAVSKSKPLPAALPVFSVEEQKYLIEADPAAPQPDEPLALAEPETAEKADA